ncbi:MAG TPA: type II toxin-antitoxin system RelE/ParE family toxin [Stellaceae bacterium]|nr:type II toxin-antitoxin system RelE/ParE family toxin [Stellaceae bacterium]
MEILWRRRALDGLEDAREYVAEHNPAAAKRILAAILAAVGRLARHPSLGRPGRVEDTRELVVVDTPYLVVYTVIDGRVHVLAIQHGAQKWPP